MKNKLTVKQEKFITSYIQLGNATEAAIVAGYSRKTATVIASQNLTKINIIARRKELEDSMASAKIMTSKERKERLSEIARGKLTDFMELGKDGSWVNLGPETPGSAAIQEIHSRTEYDENGEKPTLYTSVKMHDPMKAISELNKMDGAYAPTRQEITGKDGEPIQISLDAKAKLIGLLAYGAARLKAGEDSTKPITAGSTEPIIRLDSMGKTQSTSSR